MRNGEFANVEPAQIVAARKHHGLTQTQFAMLASTSVYKGKGGLQARRLQAWEAGDCRVPLANWELLQIRLHLLAHKLATFEELAETPLVDLVQRNIDLTKTVDSSNSIYPHKDRCPHGYREEDLDSGVSTCSACAQDRESKRSCF